MITNEDIQCLRGQMLKTFDKWAKELNSGNDTSERKVPTISKKMKLENYKYRAGQTKQHKTA